MSRTRELLAALSNASVSGFLSTPPGIDGEPGLGLPGIHGVPRARLWDAVASAEAPALHGETVTFVVLTDGTVVVDEDVPNGALEPLADALEQTLEAPYRAAALRIDDDVWTAVGEKVEIVELDGITEDEIELTVVAGERTLKLDGAPTIRPLAALDALAESDADVVIRAERVDGDLFAANVFSL